MNEKDCPAVPLSAVFAVAAPAWKVWQVLHPPAPRDARFPVVGGGHGGQVDKLSRYVSISKPLWSRAEGYHELGEQPDGTTLLTFRETYHAHNPLPRILFEGRVHAKISADNTVIYEHALAMSIARSPFY